MRKLTSNAPTKVIQISLILALANQFSGINAILFYAKQVFEHITSNKKELANQYTFYLGVLQVIITFVSGFMINRFGRRSLMLVGETIIVASLLCGFMFDHWVKDSENLITFIVFTHIIGFSISLGPVSMLYIA
jgi:SP family arabinose:H+ symporter-like MFS transporter